MADLGETGCSSYLMWEVPSVTADPTEAESTTRVVSTFKAESVLVESSVAGLEADDPQAVIASVANRIAIIVIFFILDFVFVYDCVYF